MTTVHVFGSVNQDLAVSARRCPRPGETVLGRSFTTAPGGKGANQAVAAARMGAAVRLYGAIGSDPPGDVMLANLRRERVDVSAVTAEAATTGTAILTVTDDGENSIMVIPGANTWVGTEHVRRLEDRAAPGDIVVLQLELPLPTVANALDAGRRRRATTILNAAPVQDVTALLGNVDILVVNESEATALWGAPVTNQAEARHAAGDVAARHRLSCVVTLGGAGTVVAPADGTTPFHIAAEPITPLDTTGAGDTFVGTLAVFQADTRALRDAAELATRAGSLACLAPGAQTGMPTCDQLLSPEPSS